MTKHHGMLFADRLMPSMLDGSKTQTRRPVKPQPPSYIDALHGNDLRGRAPYDLEHPESGSIVGRGFQDDDDVFYKCPWNVGDLIWARETWATTEQAGHHRVDAWPVYRATDPDWSTMEGWKWRPSIHMPKWACRCWKEITDVRVQRIQEISEEDAKAEGIGRLRPIDLGLNGGWNSIPREEWTDKAKLFGRSWSRIYPGSWERNDWVWVLEFKPAEAPQ